MNIQRAGGAGYIGASDGLNKTTKSLNKMLERLATAQRINRASDDAAGLAIAEGLSGQVRGFKMADRNGADAMSALRTTDGAASQVGEMLQRQRELTIQAKNGTLNDAQRAGLDKEFQNLSQEMTRVAATTNFNRQNLADGTGLASGTAQVQAGPNAQEQMPLPAVDISPTALGIVGTSISTELSAGSALTKIDAALTTLGTQRASVGSFFNRLESAANNLAVAEANTQAAESVIRDQDMAEGISALVRDRLLAETGAQAFSRFNQISANHILGLLQ